MSTKNNQNKICKEEINRLTAEVNKLSAHINRVENKYRSLWEKLPVGIFTTTPNGKIIEANKALLDILGIKDPGLLENLRAEDFYVDPSVRDRYLKNIDLSGTYYYEFQIKQADGEIVWGRDYPRAVIDDEGKVEYFTGVLIDITSQKIAEEKLKRVLLELERSNRERKKMISKLESLSLQDDLTGLYNRRGFFTVSKNFFHLADRKKNKMFLLFMDLDDLKKINDTWGHQKGDLALKTIADLLMKTFRRSDIIGRMGGDEFAVFPIGSTYSGVENAIQRFNKNLEGKNSSEDSPFHLSVSMGVSCYDPEFPCSLDELFVRADKLMYAEKHTKQK